MVLTVRALQQIHITAIATDTAREKLRLYRFTLSMAAAVFTSMDSISLMA